MILKIPVVIGDETVIGLFHRDHVSVALPRDKGEATALYVHGIIEPFLARVPHKLLAQFLSRAHSETHGSLDYEKSVRTKVDDKDNVRHFIDTPNRVHDGEIIAFEGRKWRVKNPVKNLRGTSYDLVLVE